MCPSLGSKGVELNGENPKLAKVNHSSQDDVLAIRPTNSSPTVFMQTLVGKMRTPKSKSNVLEPVRLLIDTGSQRSYILSYVDSKMSCVCEGEEIIFL